MEKTKDMKSIEEKETKRINDLIIELSYSFPYVSFVLHRLQFKPSKMIPTAGVDEYCRGVFNPEFTKDLNNMKMKFIIMHECMHIILKSIERFCRYEGINSLRDAPKEVLKYFTCFNIASDAIINEDLIKHMPSGSQIDDCVTFFKVSTMIEKPLKEVREMSTETIYGFLKEKQDEAEQKGEGNSISFDEGSEGEENSQSSGNGVSIEDLLDAINDAYGDMTNDQKDEFNKKLEEAIEKAKEKLESEPGTGNSKENIEVFIEKNNYKWREILYAFMSKVSGKSSSNRTWKKPSRRYREIYPISQGKTKKGCTRDVTFSIDVSGSMDENKIKKAASAMVSFAEENMINCKYYFFSNENSKIYNYTNEADFSKNLKENYGGGTAIEAALASELRDEVGEGLVVVGDMEFGCDSNHIKTIVGEYGKPVVFLNIEPHERSYYGSQVKDLYGDTDYYSEIY